MHMGYVTRILSSSIQNKDFNIIFGLGSAGSDPSTHIDYTSTEDAEKSIPLECSNKSIKNINLMDVSANFKNDGFLIRGTNKRIPTVGNSKIVIME